MLRIINAHLIKTQQLGRGLDLDREDDDQNEGVIDESNYEDFLVDDVEDLDPETETEDIDPDLELEQPEYQPEYTPEEETWEIPADSKEILYGSPSALVNDGIDNSEVISFEYTNRHGEYAGERLVEPHYTFIAITTGNEVLVTFDRSVNDIRAFIVGNIHPEGVRYENVKFNPRSDIMIGVA